MKPSELKKDTTTTIRSNGEVKALLEQAGTSAQKIYDDYIDKHIKLNRELVLKKGKK